MNRGLLDDFPPVIRINEKEEIRFWANKVKLFGKQVRYRYDIWKVNELNINRTEFYVNITSDMFGIDDRYMNTLNILF